MSDSLSVLRQCLTVNQSLSDVTVESAVEPLIEIRAMCVYFIFFFLFSPVRLFRTYSAWMFDP